MCRNPKPRVHNFKYSIAQGFIHTGTYYITWTKIAGNIYIYIYILAAAAFDVNIVMAVTVFTSPCFPVHHRCGHKIRTNCQCFQTVFFFFSLPPPTRKRRAEHGSLVVTKNVTCCSSIYVYCFLALPLLNTLKIDHAHKAGFKHEDGTSVGRTLPETNNSSFCNRGVRDHCPP